MQFKELINLVRKAGDRLVVYNSHKPNKSFVIISLEEYEKIINKKETKGLTEKELIDKINRDIAIWKEENNIDYINNKTLFFFEEEFKAEINNNSSNDFDDPYYYETKDEYEDYYEDYDEYFNHRNNIKQRLDRRSNNWKINPYVKQGASEILDNY